MNQDTFNPEVFKQQQENLHTEQPRKGKTGLIITIIIILLCGIGVGLFFILNKDSKKDEDDNKKNTKTEEKVEKKEENKENNETSTYNGVYKKDNIVFKIYCIPEKKCKASFESESYGSLLDISIKNGKAESSGISYTFENNSLTIKTNPSEFREDDPAATILNGNYTKEKDYTAEDYYKDNIGETTYINTKYNGLFELNNNKMYIIQTKNDKVRISIQGNNSIFDMEFDIQSDGSLQKDFFESTYKITVDDENAIFTTIKTDKIKNMMELIKRQKH